MEGTSSPKTVLITGAAGGLGQALYRQFHSKGWRIIATDLLEREQIMEMDVTSECSVKSVFDTIEKEGIILDLIINNAGIDRYFPLSEAATEQFEAIFKVNLFGAYRINQTFLPLLRRPGGRIIHIGSESLNLLIPFMPYPLTKNVLERYSLVLRQELRFVGIDVVAVRLGAVQTPILEAVHHISWPVSHPVLNKTFRTFSAQAKTEIGKVLTPAKAAGKIYRIALSPKPKAIYRFNNMLKLRISTLFPFPWLEKAIYRRLK
jgi:NAD(P)-dependent dehydrogenase (short-subunit alcohol dehydrogenase family)